MQREHVVLRCGVGWGGCADTTSESRQRQQAQECECGCSVEGWELLLDGLAGGVGLGCGSKHVC